MCACGVLSNFLKKVFCPFFIVVVLFLDIYSSSHFALPMLLMMLAPFPLLISCLLYSVLGNPVPKLVSSTYGAQVKGGSTWRWPWRLTCEKSSEIVVLWH